MERGKGGKGGPAGRPAEDLEGMTQVLFKKCFPVLNSELKCTSSIARLSSCRQISCCLPPPHPPRCQAPGLKKLFLSSTQTSWILDAVEEEIGPTLAENWSVLVDSSGEGNWQEQCCQEEFPRAWCDGTAHLLIMKTNTGEDS